MIRIGVLYEDNHLLAVSKPTGFPVQGDDSGDQSMVDAARDYLRYTYNKPGNVFSGLIHRLDRPVSGVLMIAKTSKALSRMTQLFNKREIEKTYWALVSRRPEAEEGTLVHWLTKDTKRNVSRASAKQSGNAKRAELSYRFLKRIGRYYLLEIKPLTGRSHQIRLQLARMGCSVVGDLKYGYPQANPDAGICLHALKLNFIHPVRKVPIEIKAPLPSTQLWRPFMEK